MNANPRPRRGGAVLQVIVVFAILGLLAALLLPAIQAAREAARQVQCRNNLKQIAFACLNHEQCQERLPSGGWGGAWTGDSGLGSGQSQPGGWIYNTLPYIESNSYYDMDCGMPQAEQCAARLMRLKLPFCVYYCPSRRPSLLYPWTNSWGLVNADMPSSVTRTDYASNGGDVYTSAGFPTAPLWQSALPSDRFGPASLAEGGVKGTESQTANANQTFENIAATATGVIFCGSTVKIEDLTDGTANTYLVGEKYLGPDWYATGTSPGDNLAALVGDNDNIARWSFLPPLQDRPGYTGRLRFGSAHPTGFHMAFCDGSVKPTKYSIDPAVHRAMGNRKDTPKTEEEEE